MKTVPMIHKHALALAIGSALLAPIAAQAAGPQVANGVPVVLAPGTYVSTPGNNVLTAINGGSIANSGPVTVSNTNTAAGSGSHGVSVNGAGSSATLTDATISTVGESGNGIQVRNGGHVEMVGGRITTSGPGNAAAAYVGDSFGAASIEIRDADIHTTGGGAEGLLAQAAGTQAVLINTNIVTEGNSARGVSAGSGSSVDITGGKITTMGSNAHGAMAVTGSTVNATGVEVSTRGRDAYGVLADGAGSKIDVNDGNLTTAGENAHGIYARNGGTVNAARVDIVTSGINAHGALAEGAGSLVDYQGGNIQTAGVKSRGIFAIDGAHISATDVSIHATGDQALGVEAQGATVELVGVSIKTEGDRVDNFSAAGASATAGGAIKMTDSKIETTGYWADGLDVKGAGSAIEMVGGSIHTTGDNSRGAVAYGGGNSVALNGVSIRTEGEKARGLVADGVLDGVASSVSMAGGSVTTTGASAHAAQARNGGHVELVDTSFKTRGDGAYGIHAMNGGTVNATRVDIETFGKNAHGVYADGATSKVNLLGGSITTIAKDAFGLVIDNGGSIDADSTVISSNADGLVARGSGSIVGKNLAVTAVKTGVNVLADSTVDLTDSVVNSNTGAMVSDGGKLTASNTNFNSDWIGVRASTAGIVDITGGSITVGDYGFGAVDSWQDADVSLDGVTVKSAGYGATAYTGGKLSFKDTDLTSVGIGVNVGSDSAFTAERSSIATTGAGAIGVNVVNARADLIDTTIDTAGDYAHGVSAESGSAINATNVDATTSGYGAAGATATDAGSTINIRGGSYATSGVFSHGVSAANGGAVVIDRDPRTGEGTFIHTTGASSRGIAADNGTIIVNGATIKTEGNKEGILGAEGAFAVNGGSVVLTDSTIETLGSYASGIYAETGGSFDMNGGSILTKGQGATGAALYNSATGALSNLDIRTEGNNARGVVSRSAGSVMSVSNTAITTMGVGAYGVHALEGARADLIDTTIETSGDNAHGIHAQNGGTINATNVDVTTTGEGANGVYADGSSSKVNLSGGSITTTGTSGSHGLYAENGAVITADGTVINASATGLVARSGGRISGNGLTVNGEQSGINVYADSVVDLADSTVSSHLNAATVIDGGILTASNTHFSSDWTGVRTSGGQINLTGGSVTIADGGFGAVDSWQSGQVSLDGVTVTSGGYGATVSTGSTLSMTGSALTSVGIGVNVGTESAFTAERSSITTTGTGAIGVKVANARADLIDTTIETSGDNAHGIHAQSGGAVTAARVAIRTEGEGGRGIVASGVLGDVASSVSMTGGSILTTGDNATGVYVDSGAVANLNGAHVRTEGAGSWGAQVNGTLNVDGGSLVSAQHGAINATGNATIALSNGAQAIGGNGTLLSIADEGSMVSLSMDNKVYAEGDIVGVDSDGDGTLLAGTNVSLANASHWKGATDGSVNQLSLASGSQWTMTGDSMVGQLSLNDSVIAFQAPTAGDFKTLTVTGDFASNGGTLLMNTVLGDDRSATDKLHVMGNTSGQANVAVNNIGGIGAQTVDGIQIVQVDGLSDGQFDLAGRAVGGAYEYFLFKGGKTDPNDGDWYLRSELPVVPPEPCEADPNAPGCKPVEPPVPVLRPEVGAYLANQTAAVGMFQQAMHDRIGEPNLAERLKNDDTLGSAWVRVLGNQADYSMLSDQLDVSSNHSLLQIGTDLAHWGESSRGQIGLMAAAGRVNNTSVSNLTGYAAKGTVDGTALGVYGTWFAHPADLTGAYMDSWVQYGRFKDSVQGVGLQEENYEARAMTGSIESGYAFRVFEGKGAALFIEPQVQMTYTDYRSDAHIESNGTVVESDIAGGLSTRAGVRIYGHDRTERGNLVQPFVTANWLHDQDRNAMSFGGTQMIGGVPQDRYELKAGLQMQLSDRWTGWGDLGVQSGANEYRSVGGQLGVKYSW